MKKVLPWLSFLAILLLVSCNLPSVGGNRPPVVDSTATLSPIQIQTQISSLLTQLPATEGAPPVEEEEPSPAPELPTVAVVTATTAPEEPTAEPTAEPTEEPTAEPTSVPPTEESEATTAPEEEAPADTAAPSPAPEEASGSLVSDFSGATDIDHMDSSDTWNWPIGRDKYTRATFANGTQEVETLSKMDGWRLASPPDAYYGFTNVTVEAVFKTGSECTGNAHYGIIVRAPGVRKPREGYLFGITCDGRYSLRRWYDKAKHDGKYHGGETSDGEMWDVIHDSRYFFEGSWIDSTAINKGANQVNTLRIDTIGDTFTLYANGTKLAEVHVKEARGHYFPDGFFGVFLGPGNMDKLRVQLDEMAYWVK